MAQTTPEPTLISPVSETDAKPYTPPSKKNHVPAGVARLIFVGLGLLLTLLAVVLIFSHKMSPTKAHGQASKRTPAQQQTTATTGVMPADENNTPSAATGSDPDSITPDEILATKNTLEAQKRHAKEAAAEAAATLAGTGQGTAGGAHLPAGAAGSMQTSKQFSALQKTIGSIAPFQPPAYNGASTPVQSSSGSGAVGTQYPSGASYGEATRAWNDEVTKTRIVFSRKSVPAEADATQYLGPAITNFGLEPGFHVAARLEDIGRSTRYCRDRIQLRAQRANCPTGGKPCDWAHQQRRCARQYGDHV